MQNTFNRLRLFFLGALVLSCGAVWVYQVYYVWPRKQCEAMGDWWDSKDRQCGVPMPIWRITGRHVPPSTPKPTPAHKPATAG